MNRIIVVLVLFFIQAKLYSYNSTIFFSLNEIIDIALGVNTKIVEAKLEQKYKDKILSNSNKYWVPTLTPKVSYEYEELREYYPYIEQTKSRHQLLFGAIVNNKLPFLGTELSIGTDLGVYGQYEYDAYENPAFFFEISVKQPILKNFLKATIMPSEKISKLERAVLGIDMQKKKVEVIADTISRWWRLYVLEKEVEFEEINIKRLAENERVTMELYNVGKVTSVDLDFSKLELINAKNKLAYARSQQKKEANELLLTINLTNYNIYKFDFNSSEEIRTNFFLNEDNLNFEEFSNKIPKEIIMSNYELKGLIAKQGMEEINLKLSTYEKLPNLYIDFQYTGRRHFKKDSLKTFAFSAATDIDNFQVLVEFLYPIGLNEERNTFFQNEKILELSKIKIKNLEANLKQIYINLLELNKIYQKRESYSLAKVKYFEKKLEVEQALRKAGRSVYLNEIKIYSELEFARKQYLENIAEKWQNTVTFVSYFPKVLCNTTKYC